MTKVNWLIIILIVVIFGMMVSQETANYAEQIDQSTSNTSESLLIANGSAEELDGPIAQVTMLNAKNQSWLEFDGVNDEIETVRLQETPVTNISNTDKLTISVWIRLNNKSTSSSGTYVGLVGRGGQYRDWGIILENDYDVTFNVFNGSVGDPESRINVRSSIQTPDDNKWYHWAGTYNNNTGNMSLFVNGTIQVSVSTNGTNLVDTDKDKKIEIGGNGNTEAFSGGIDEVRIYNRTLSPTEISEIYLSGRTANASLPSDGLILWYAFNEGSGTTVYDLSGNGLNGT